MIKSKSKAYQSIQQWRRKLQAYKGPNVAAKEEYLEYLDSIEFYVKDLERALRDKQFFHSLQRKQVQPRQTSVSKLESEIANLKLLLRVHGIQETDLPYIYADMKEIRRASCIANARNQWPELF